MAKYRKVNPQRWNEPRVRALSKPQPNGLSLYWFLKTGPQTGIIPGLYEARAGGLADYLGWPLEAFHEAFQEAIRQGLAKACWEAGLVFVPDAVEDDPPQSVNAATAWGVACSELPDCELKTEGFRHVLAYLEGKNQVFAEAFAKASLIQITDNRIQTADSRPQTQRTSENVRSGSVEGSGEEEAQPGGASPGGRLSAAPDPERLRQARDAANRKVARAGKETRAKQGKPELPPMPAIGELFQAGSDEERQKLLDQFEGGAGKARQQKLVKMVQDEVLRVYRAEKKRATGNGYIRVGEKGLDAARDIGLACVGYGFTPEQLMKYWQEPGNNWTNMAFPSLAFMANEKNLDRVAVSVIRGAGRRTQVTERSHQYDPKQLDPRVRPALLKAGFKVKGMSDRNLMTVQNAAKELAAGRTPGMPLSLKVTAEAIVPLFQKS